MPISTQHSYHVVLVTDDSLQLKLLTGLIQKHANTVCVSVGHHKVRTEKTLRKANLIIIDERALPDNALTLCKGIKSQDSQAKIILIAGLRDQLNLSQAIKAKTADDYLLFPIDTNKLNLLLTKYLKKSPATYPPKGIKALTKNTPFTALSSLAKHKESSQPRLKPGSMLASLNRIYPGIVDGKWQESDSFK
tara:strand:+ start:8461 stop:9036 length:576 start_codon:yes stop_codon:yes gene_type:complete